ncbi:MAG: crossover junction endodeoxyribonuclease RuvC [Candidatus Margulisiibacteriota bacterium]
MRIIGIDPGIAIVGFGVIDCKANQTHAVSYGAITTPADMPVGKRLLTIQKNLETVLENHRPESCGLETLYFSKNVKTAMAVSQARGVILCTLEAFNIPVFHYSPTQVKSAILGFGGAEKKQVQFMTKELLKLPKVPKPDDVADALAIAICHHHSNSIIYKG